MKSLTSGRSALIAVVVVGFSAGMLLGSLDWIFSGGPETTGADAPEIVDIEDGVERLYRIEPENGSSVQYRVQERLGGRASEAVGATTVVAGDIVVNTEDPKASRIGEIWVNVENFTSDSTLRDKRLRHDYLESSHFPIAVFFPTSIQGLPDSVDAAGTTAAELTITGRLTVKDTPAPAVFRGPVTVDGTELRATLTATVLMSDHEIGPINLSGLVHSGNEVELTFDLVARRIAAGTDSSAADVEVSPVAAPVGDGGEFAATVQPILESRCVSCHTIGGPGSTTILLDTAGDAAEIAADIALVTRSGYMPPWPASDLGLEMEHDYSLPDDELEAIARWVAAGGGIDVPADTILTPVNPPYPAIEEDLVLVPDEPYTGSLDRRDDYRCVTVDVPDPEGDGTWVVGSEFRPDKIEVVHHSIMNVVMADSREAIDAFDAAEPGTGFTCYATVGGLPGVNGRSIGGWTPGRQPRVLPEGYAIWLPPGSFIVNQIHYHYDHSNPPDASQIVFDTVSSEEVQALAAAGTPLKALQGRSYLTPAEGPCTAEEQATGSPLCDRNTVLAQITGKYGQLFGELPDGLIRRCGGELADYAQLDGTRFASVCDVQARNFGWIESIGPHMHEFGAAYRMTLNPDTPDEQILVDIPTWSFEWQLVYEPVEDVMIEEGDILRIECEWDRSLVHMPEPRYITWSDGTVDEMCFSSVTVRPFADS